MDNFDQQMTELTRTENVIKNTIRVLKESSYAGAQCFHVANGINFLTDLERQVGEQREALAQAKKQSKADLKVADSGAAQETQASTEPQAAASGS